MESKFYSLFGKERKPIIGMIHLAGETAEDKVKRAFKELDIYEQEGLSGAIVEDYSCGVSDFLFALRKISERDNHLVLGINFLRNPLGSFSLATERGVKFVQVDAYSRTNYNDERMKNPDLVVLGGVQFKYRPQTGRTLEEDIQIGRSCLDAIATTGEGTGIETPLKKLRDFRIHMSEFPLIVGAGVTAENAYEQLQVADGAIVGSYFKGGSTHLPVQRDLVRRLMDQVQKIPR